MKGKAKEQEEEEEGVQFYTEQLQTEAGSHIKPCAVELYGSYPIISWKQRCMRDWVNSNLPYGNRTKHPAFRNTILVLHPYGPIFNRATSLFLKTRQNTYNSPLS